MGKMKLRHSGQSLVEYGVILAIIAIVAISVLTGVGQRTTVRLAQVNDGLEEVAVAASTAAGRPPVASPGEGSENGKGKGKGKGKPKHSLN